MQSIAFTESKPNTLGIELELQIVDPHTFDLKGAAEDLLAQIVNHPYADRVKPEITRSMIELNSSVHTDANRLLAEMRDMRKLLVEAADAVGVRVAGGGTHAFMRWNERAIYDAPRFQYLSEMYGYLAQQFTVFGQHIHLGVPSGDDAIALTHKLSCYVPHFIVLAASSPYFEGVDTLFACSRLNALNAFPLCGHLPPEVGDWQGFERYFSQMQSSGLIESIKDLYWDVRPKPEFGTVEVRVCDTPLTVERACQIAAFAQALGAVLADEPVPDAQAWQAYRTNRFQASRFGIHGSYVDAAEGRMRLSDHLRATFERLLPVAREQGTADMLEALFDDTFKGGDSQWLREQFDRSQDVTQAVAAAVDLWRGETPAEVVPDLPARRRVRASSEPIFNMDTLQPFDFKRLGSRLH
ncbi:Carboxylate-amine ligase YbdK [Pigmentiphaga humi]|uniref:Putative glutamate--cysteine ligase 2 n=1 Tax=Pigmentiphaga humi TaxID=2478468 RepID=A0A3P4B4C6_9BURK|nr:YbdK family carboxylate-amine ligase [Pigmentiphaga humi]VCU70488.1 Carboxylate-amine ligase YbdK [Pigmentiphaga humi]